MPSAWSTLDSRRQQQVIDRVAAVCAADLPVEACFVTQQGTFVVVPYGEAVDLKLERGLRTLHELLADEFGVIDLVQVVGDDLHSVVAEAELERPVYVNGEG